MSSPENSHFRESTDVATGTAALLTEKTKSHMDVSVAAYLDEYSRTKMLSTSEKRRLKRKRYRKGKLKLPSTSTNQPPAVESIKRTVTYQSVPYGKEKGQETEGIEMVIAHESFPYGRLEKEETEGIKMVIACQSFPYDKLKKGQEALIINEIFKRIDLIHSGKCLPKITSCPVLYGGALHIMCEEEFTMNWVKKTFDGNKEVLGGEALKVLKAEELPKPVVVAFKTRDVFTKDPRVLLKRLNRFNPQLNAEEWQALNSDVGPVSIQWTFEVDWAAADVIKKANYAAFTGIDRGSFKIIQHPGEKATQPDGVGVKDASKPDGGDKNNTSHPHGGDKKSSSQPDSSDKKDASEVNVTSSKGDKVAHVMYPTYGSGNEDPAEHRASVCPQFFINP